jgi:hypothetical protein
MEKGTRVHLFKVSDEVFEGQHPNDINPGFEITGDLVTKLEVGGGLFLNNCKHRSYEWFHTSTVTDIIDEHTFKTLNSTYKIEEV